MYYRFPPCGDNASLASELAARVATMPYDAKGNRAYVDTDTFAPGVAVRGLTNYDEATRRNLIADAEAIYRRVRSRLPINPSPRRSAACPSCGRPLSAGHGGAEAA